VIKIKISDDKVRYAKDKICEFDKQKVYDKFKCDNNFIGLLGELVFANFLLENGINHKWYNFVKQETDKADFLINKKTADIKTTLDCKLWFQKPEHDVYILARVNPDLAFLYIVAVITKDEMLNLISKNKVKVVERDNRKDYTIRISQMHEIYSLNDLLKHFEGDTNGN
jgi:hypothetical protein